MKHSHARFLIFFFIAILIFPFCRQQESDNLDKKISAPIKSVNVYTNRYFSLDQQLFNQFESRTKIHVNVVHAAARELIGKLHSQSDSFPADIVIVDDIRSLFEVKKQDFLQPFSSPKMERNVPSAYKDIRGFWVGLSRKPVAIAFSKERVDPTGLNSYQALTDATWKGRILLSSAQYSAHTSVLACMITEKGENTAESWLNGLKAGQAERPAESDFDLIEAIAGGEGDLALINAGSLVQLQRSGNPDNFQTGESIGIVFPPETNFSLRVIGMAKNAPNRANAMQLIEFLTGTDAQRAFTENLFEYPVNPMVVQSDFLVNMGGFKEALVDWNQVEENIDRFNAVLMRGE